MDVSPKEASRWDFAIRYDLSDSLSRLNDITYSILPTYLLTYLPTCLLAWAIFHTQAIVGEPAVRENKFSVDLRDMSSKKRHLRNFPRANLNVAGPAAPN